MGSSTLGKYIEQIAGYLGLSAMIVVVALTLVTTAVFIVATIWLVSIGSMSMWWLLAAIFLGWWLYTIWLAQLR
jgi:hypothetical protein